MTTTKAENLLVLVESITGVMTQDHIDTDEIIFLEDILDDDTKYYIVDKTEEKDPFILLSVDKTGLEEFYDLEEYPDCPDVLIEDLDDDDTSETMKKWVIRDGKKVRKLICKPGFKSNGKKCIRMTAKEKSSHKRAGRKISRAMKRISKTSSYKRKRAKSMRIRKKLIRK